MKDMEHTAIETPEIDELSDQALDRAEITEYWCIGNTGA